MFAFLFNLSHWAPDTWTIKVFPLLSAFIQPVFFHCLLCTKLRAKVWEHDNGLAAVVFSQASGSGWEHGWMNTDETLIIMGIIF